MQGDLHLGICCSKAVLAEKRGEVIRIAFQIKVSFEMKTALLQSLLNKNMFPEKKNGDH